MAALSALIGGIMCAVGLAQANVYEYSCCTRDVPKGSAESLQNSGPVCYSNAEGTQQVCSSIEDDCWAVGTTLHLTLRSSPS